MAEFIKVFNMKGFDVHRTPRWQMVPVGVGNERFVALRDGVGLTVTSSNPGVVTVTEVAQTTLAAGVWGHERTTLHATDRVFKLLGNKADAAVIQATGGPTVLELEVDAKEEKTLRITFNFVAKNIKHKTSRVPAQAAEWVKTMNYILHNQANIKIISKDARWIELDKDIGRILTTTSTGVGEEGELYPKEDPDADINVFLVKALNFTDDPDDEDAFTDGEHVPGSRPGPRIVVEDTTTEPMGEVLAHEVGHALGLEDQDTTPRELMFGSQGSGIHLPKQDVNHINR